MARDYESPGVGYEEQEEYGSRSEVYNPIIAIVGGATKGNPSEVVEVKSCKKLKSLFGKATDNSYAVAAADYILEEKCVVLFKRVLGSDKNKGSAGTEAEDLFTFKSRDYDSNLEGAIIALKFDKESKKVNYSLKVNGKVVESYNNLSYEKNNSKYLPKFLLMMNSPLEVGVHDTVVDPKDANLTLRGVDDGIASIKPEDYIAAAGEFGNVDDTEMGLIIVPGVTDSKVQKEYEDLARERGDVMYIPDIPFGTNPNTALAFSNAVDSDSSQTKFNNAEVCMFGPWVKVTDVSRKEDVWMPPSVIAARVFTQSDNKAGGCWFAAAGFGSAETDGKGRGVVPRAVACEYILTKEDRDSWLGSGNVLNPIVKFKGLGIALFGNRTTLRTEEYEDESFYTSINIRRMANYIKRIIIKISLKRLFDPNDPLTWAAWKTELNPELKKIKDGRGIEDYKIVMDETTVTEDDIKKQQAPGYVYIKPIRALEWIPIKFIATDNSVIFEDENTGDEEVYVSE